MARPIHRIKLAGAGDGAIWLNRFWTVRKPSLDVLATIRDTVGDDLRYFGGDPGAVIRVVRVLAQGRTFKTTEHLSVHPAEIPALLERAKELK